MKIGILTYHRAINYGAVFQTYGLKFYLESIGHKVEVIDYWPKYHIDEYKLFSFNQLKKHSFLGKCRYIS